RRLDAVRPGAAARAAAHRLGACMSRKWARIITWALLAVFLAIAIPWVVDWYRTRPEWWDPVLRYMIHTGLTAALRMADPSGPAAAVGAGRTGTRAFGVVPEAVRRVLPPLSGVLVNIVQNPTIAGLIGVGGRRQTGSGSAERGLLSPVDADYLSLYLAVFVFFF